MLYRWRHFVVLAGCGPLNGIIVHARRQGCSVQGGHLSRSQPLEETKCHFCFVKQLDVEREPRLLEEIYYFMRGKQLSLKKSHSSTSEEDVW